MQTKLKDYLGRDLKGWAIKYCYFLELETTLMGNYPAITSQEWAVVAVWNKSLLKIVWDKLPPRQAKVSRVLALGCASYGMAFNLESPSDKTEVEPMRLFSSAELLGSQEVEWAGGLLSLSTSPVTPPSFQ